MVITFISRRDNETKMQMVSRTTEGKNLIRILNGKDSGTEKEITDGTLKRWWRQLEEKIEEPSEVIGTPSNTKKNKRSEEKERIKGRLASYNSKYFDNVACYKIFRPGEVKKAVAEVYPRSKHIEIRVKTKSSDVQVPYKEGYKYYLPVHYFIAYEHIDYLDIMETLLKSYL